MDIMKNVDQQIGIDQVGKWTNDWLLSVNRPDFTRSADGLGIKVANSGAILKLHLLIREP